jgi:hypothetical protein
VAHSRSITNGSVWISAEFLHNSQRAGSPPSARPCMYHAAVERGYHAGRGYFDARKWRQQVETCEGQCAKDGSCKLIIPSISRLKDRRLQRVCRREVAPQAVVLQPAMTGLPTGVMKKRNRQRKPDVGFQGGRVNEHVEIGRQNCRSGTERPRTPIRARTSPSPSIQIRPGAW